MENINEILEEYVCGLKEILGSNLERVILYGSYARGEQQLGDEISDIDIMILVHFSAPDIEDEVIGYSYEMDLKYNILLSPVIETIQNYNSRINYIPFYKNIQNQGVLINGR